MTRSYFIIDAFAHEPFSGNPAAVVFDADGLDDRTMQAIASEFNLSETTFVLPPASPVAAPAPRPSPAFSDSMSDATAGRDQDKGPDLSVRFRWFTPTTEVNMCGHATIAGVHALVESGRLPVNKATPTATVSIETKSACKAGLPGKAVASNRSGSRSNAASLQQSSGATLTAYVEPIPGTKGKRMIWLDLVDARLSAHALPLGQLASVLKLPADAFDPSLPSERTQDRDVLVFVRDFQRLNAARPDFARLSELLDQHQLRGLCLATVATTTPSIHVQSRFFAPTAGVDEDPVTGSVHGPLAAYLVKHGRVPVSKEGLAGLMCVQGMPGARAGLVNVLVHPEPDGTYAVRIGGRAVTTMRGCLQLSDVP